MSFLDNILNLFDKKEEKLPKKEEDNFEKDFFDVTTTNGKMFEAIRNNDLKELQKALKNGADFESRNHSGLNAMSLCILEKRREIFGFLIEQGANLNSEANLRGETLLTFSLTKSIRHEFAFILLKSGADPNVMTQGDDKSSPVTPLMAAILHASYDIKNNFDLEKNEDYQIIQMLIPSSKLNTKRGVLGQNVIDLALHFHFKHNYLNSKLPEIQRKKDFLGLNIIDSLFQHADLNSFDLTAHFLKCCEVGDYDLACIFLNHHISVRAGNDRGQTPLALAASAGHVQVCQLLIDKGANVNSLDQDGYNPLIEAASHGKKECVDLLLHYGANNLPFPGSSKTAAGLARQNSFFDLAQYIEVEESRRQLQSSVPIKEKTHLSKRL